jgi:hypothetical protein
MKRPNTTMGDSTAIGAVSYRARQLSMWDMAKPGCTTRTVGQFQYCLVSLTYNGTCWTITHIKAEDETPEMLKEAGL